MWPMWLMPLTRWQLVVYGKENRGPSTNGVGPLGRLEQGELKGHGYGVRVKMREIRVVRGRRRDASSNGEAQKNEGL